ncbi:DUF3143 domain-containing protein [Synechococcus sp. MIT S1220]|uniref:DUF3143 domain-containing protein n=1 Tax=Synechococcus sp. MIT S1220 TaxID=3082549 RepID=UPI0039AF6546
MELGADPMVGNPCCWSLIHPDWTAELLLDREHLHVTWQQPEQRSRQCVLPYGLSRADVTAAIQAGPDYS